MLAVAVGVEEPVSLTLRPGLRFDIGPLYLRPAVQLVAVPTFHWGILVGVGADFDVGGGWSLGPEADVALWPERIDLVELTFRLVVNHAF